MRFIRTYETRPWHEEWFHKKPNLDLLLRCFDKGVQNSDPVSVFEADTSMKEVECVAAHFQTYNKASVTKQYAVRIHSRDCERAGIQVEADKGEGRTGLKDIDEKHYNLIGNQQQFMNLAKEIVAKIWEGEDRLRVLPEAQLRAQLTVFVHLQANLIASEAKQRCEKALSKTSTMQKKSENGQYVEIYGSLICKSNDEIEVAARRHISLDSSKWIRNKLQNMWTTLMEKLGY